MFKCPSLALIGPRATGDRNVTANLLIHDIPGGVTSRSDASAGVDIKPRIIGGQTASTGQFPYQVSIRINGAHVCGGTIFNKRFVITAGHCVDKAKKHQLLVVSGSIHLTNLTVANLVRRITIHPDYYYIAGSIPVNDVALLELKTDLPLDGTGISSIPLRTTSVPGNTSCDVSGWGHFTFSNDSLSKVLNFVQIPVMSCSSYENTVILPGMFCAGFEVGGKDSFVCPQGDSGGPLVCEGQLAGIVSWGYDCAIPMYPGVYANVSYYRSWLLLNDCPALVAHRGLMVAAAVVGMLASCLAVGDSSRSTELDDISVSLLSRNVTTDWREAENISTSSVFQVSASSYQNDTQFPFIQISYQVSLRRGGSHICGGALISRRLVVTAAHCVYSLVPYDLTVVSGTSKLTSLTHISSVRRIVWHENYTVKNNRRINDIALLELTEDLPFDGVNLSSLVLKNETTAENSSCLITGWGFYDSTSSVSSVMNYVGVFTTICDVFEEYEDMEPEMLCAGNHLGGDMSCQVACDDLYRVTCDDLYKVTCDELYSVTCDDLYSVTSDDLYSVTCDDLYKVTCDDLYRVTCDDYVQGDFGGPMMCDDYLVGITSYGGYPCSNSTYPGVYTNVSNYLSWIIANRSSSLTSNTTLIVILLVAASIWKFH
uniref:Peptidase S1 domain-containing protein n=1 Tax=Timema tahoe TaxID=61484 RepID=A0A7R9FNA2_9NEOP|nr:unnamed protein product [Timema tahoe]